MDLMAQHNEPFSVTIYDDPPGLSAVTFFRRDFQLLIISLILPFFLLAAEGLPVISRVFMMLFCWGAIGFYVRSNIKFGPSAMFEADRTGFRIKGGRLRHWDTFLGASIEHHVIDHEDVYACRVQLLGQTFDQALRIGTYEYSSEADSAVQRILALKQKIDARQAEEAANLALGAAPVVEARAKRMAENIRGVSIWERVGFVLGRY